MTTERLPRPISSGNRLLPERGQRDLQPSAPGIKGIAFLPPDEAPESPGFWTAIKIGGTAMKRERETVHQRGRLVYQLEETPPMGRRLLYAMQFVIIFIGSIVLGADACRGRSGLGTRAGHIPAPVCHLYRGHRPLLSRPRAWDRWGPGFRSFWGRRLW